MFDTLVKVQSMLDYKHMKLMAVSVHPDYKDTLEAELNDNKERLVVLEGLQITPYYPQTTTVQRHLSSIQMFNAILTELEKQGIVLRDDGGDFVNIETIARTMYKVIGVDYDLLTKEQNELIKKQEGCDVNSGEDKTD